MWVKGEVSYLSSWHSVMGAIWDCCRVRVLRNDRVNICHPHPQFRTFRWRMFPQTWANILMESTSKNHTNVRAHTYSAKHTPLTATVPHRVSIKPPMCNMHHHYTLYQGSSGEANQEKHSCILPPRLSFSLIEPTDMHKSQITTLQWKINSEVSWQYSNVKRSTSPAMIQQQ